MSGQFRSDLVIRVLNDCGPRPLVETMQPLHYSSDVYGTIVVPAHFVFDGASIPTPAMGLIGWPAIRAACVHDYLLAHAADGTLQWPREQIDLVFKEALQACGLADATAALMYGAVASYTQSLKPSTPIDPYNPTA